MPRAELATCAVGEALVHEALDGDVAASELLAGHLDECLSCRAALAAYRRLRRLLAELRAEELALPPGLLADVLHAVGGAADRRALVVARSHARLKSLGAAIVATVVIAGLLTLVRLWRRRA